MITTIRSEAEATDLAATLLKVGRKRPAVVVSVAAGTDQPFTNVQELDKAVGTDCDVFVIHTGQHTYAFADALPPGRQVYGGASRVYSVDNSWVHDQYRSALRFSFGPDTNDHVLNLLIEDAMTAAFAAGGGPNANPRAGTRRHVSGTVQGILAGRVLVDTGERWPSVAYPDRLVPRLGAARLFRKGQQVEGGLDTESNVLHIETILEAGDVLHGLGVETVLLARVASVTADSVKLELHPQFTIPVRPDEAGEDLRATYTPGEIVPVEVTGVDGDGLPASLTVLPTTFADLASPVALLAGGPPWLTAPDESDLLADNEPQDDPPTSESVSTLHDPDAVTATDQEVHGLQDEVQRLEAKVRHLEGQLQTARSRTRDERQKASRLEKELTQAQDVSQWASPGIFANATEQFLHETYVSWAERTTAADKETYPWRAPTLGPDFLASMDQVQGIDRAKVVEVCADVACGRADTMPARAVHQLRSGAGGDDAPVTRAGGETCWRVYLQHKSPSARRLHYWRLNDGGIELSSVRQHDDFTP